MNLYYLWNKKKRKSFNLFWLKTQEHTFFIEFPAQFISFKVYFPKWCLSGLSYYRFPVSEPSLWPSLLSSLILTKHLPFVVDTTLDTFLIDSLQVFNINSLSGGLNSFSLYSPRFRLMSLLLVKVVTLKSNRWSLTHQIQYPLPHIHSRSLLAFQNILFFWLP